MLINGKELIIQMFLKICFIFIKQIFIIIIFIIIFNGWDMNGKAIRHCISHRRKLTTQLQVMHSKETAATDEKKKCALSKWEIKVLIGD